MTPFYQTEYGSLYNGEDLQVMKIFPDNYFKMVITSPPYNIKGIRMTDAPYKAKRDDQRRNNEYKGSISIKPYATFDDAMPHEKYVEWQRSVIRELWRLIDNDGAIYYNHKARHVAKRLWLPTDLIPPNEGIILRDLVHWDRLSGYEYCPTHYCPQEEWIMIIAKDDWKLKDRKSSKKGNRGNIWRIAPAIGNPHPAPFPIELPLYALETTSEKSQPVLDCYGGSGTTAFACEMSKRSWVLIEKSEAYCKDYIQLGLKRLKYGMNPIGKDVKIKGGLLDEYVSTGDLS